MEYEMEMINKESIFIFLAELLIAEFDCELEHEFKIKQIKRIF